MSSALVIGWQYENRNENPVALTGSLRLALHLPSQERLPFLVLPKLASDNLAVLPGRGVWLTNNLYELLQKSPAQSFTVYLQPFIIPGTLLRISISWVVLLFILSAWRCSHLGSMPLYEPPNKLFAAGSRRPFLVYAIWTDRFAKTQQGDKEHRSDSQQG